MSAQEAIALVVPALIGALVGGAGSWLALRGKAPPGGSRLR